MLQGFVVMPYFVLRAFERWDDILRLPKPAPSFGYVSAQWHFARAMALGALKKKPEATHEAHAYVAEISKLKPDAKVDQFSSVSDIARIQENLLAAAVQLAGGEGEEEDEQEEKGEVVEALQHAIAAEDNLHYNEPPTWFPPVRVWYGEILLEQKKAVAAEKVFRSALEKFPRYYRALAGLRDSLKAQKRDYEATLVDQQLRSVQAANGSPARGRK